MKTYLAALCVFTLLPVRLSLSAPSDAQPAADVSAAYVPGAGTHSSMAADLGSPTVALPNYPDASDFGTTLSEDLPVAAAGAGLIIDATFDSSITSDPNAAAIESTINKAISICQSLFRDPIRVSILFRYSTRGPDGAVLAPGLIAQSRWVYYTGPAAGYLDALRADASTSNDSAANSTLPASPLSTSMRPTSASGRAIGLPTPPSMYADGRVASGGPYDGIVTLNAARPIQFSRPTSSSSFDALRTIEHEMDEILGLGSMLNLGGTDLRPQDLFTWSAAGVRNRSTSGSRYFSINSGRNAIVGLNQKSGYDYGDWFSAPCPQASPLVQNAFSCLGQYSDISATSPEGINLDVIGYDLVTSTTGPSPAQLQNISTRLNVLNNDNALIGGFIVTGSAPKKVLLRAIGPSLGVAGALRNPTLELHFPNGTIVPNDNWKINDQTGQSQEAAIRATTIPPPNDFESGTLQTLAPGAYTAIVRGNSGGTGLGLIDAYDLDQAAPSKLANISTRGFVQTGNNVMIGGFIVGPGNATRTNVVVRALGPSLPVTNPLQDPTLELHDSNGVIIASNDNWQEDARASEVAAATLAPQDSRESALSRGLTPGAYTAILAGRDGTTGIGLVEVYNLQ